MQIYPVCIFFYQVAHQVKLQLKQITPSNNPPQYIQVYPQSFQNAKTINQSAFDTNMRQVSKERERESTSSNQSNPKGYQSLDQKDTSTQAQSFTQSLMKQSQQQQLQNYIDSALKNQKQEMLKLFDHQNKQIEFMQQIIVSQTQVQQNNQQSFIQFESQIEEKVQKTILKVSQELEGRVKKNYQKEFQTLFIQLEKLKAQIFQVNITNSKLISDKLQSSFQSYDQQQEDRASQAKLQKDCYYKQDIKINHCNIYEGEIQQQPLSDITNIPIRYIKSLQQSLQNSKLSKCSSNNNTKLEEDSPIEVLNEQNMLDSLDNIKVFDPNYPNSLDNQQESTECNYLINSEQQCRMSTIHENEYEDDECIYQVDDIGYSLDHHPLIDEKGKKRIQQSKLKSQKSKTLYY